MGYCNTCQLFDLSIALFNSRMSSFIDRNCSCIFLISSRCSLRLNATCVFNKTYHTNLNFMVRLILSFILFIAIDANAQKWEGLAQTPPMGWNSWNTFQGNINEKLVMETADAMVTSGMRDAGYLYLVLDDAWMAKERDARTGDLVPDPVKFPHGMKYVSDYVHSKGLKFGLYNCAGTLTCAGCPGTRGYEYQDARFYASLAIDYLKFDWCYADS